MKFAILFGGNSYEHEISIVSAMSVAEKLPSVEFIYCSYEREFFNIAKSDMKATYFANGEYKKLKPLSLVKGTFAHKSLFGAKKLEFDVLINLIHGKDGEDGTISGLLDFYEICYLGARTQGCVLSFDKALCKQYAASVGVATLPGYLINDIKELNRLADGPLIAKPARLGSSIGIAVAKTANMREYAYESAAEFDKRVLFEPFIPGVREINLAGYRSRSGEIVFSRCEEPAKSELLDFDDKYLSFKQREAAEANLSPQLVEKLHDAFSKIYANVFDGAIIRADFFIIDDEVYLNEINPHPGSLANYLFEDFAAAVADVALPKPSVLGKEFKYLNKIVQAK